MVPLGGGEEPAWGFLSREAWEPSRPAREATCATAAARTAGPSSRRLGASSASESRCPLSP